MRQDLLASLRRLSDAELVARVQDLAERERGAMVLLVAHLAELDTRDVHFRAGHGSLFAYCRDVLGLSEQEAYNRIAVARASRRFPVILEMLEAGSVSLTTVRLLGPHLTIDNHARVLHSARGKTRVQVEEIAAALWPRPDAPSFVRKLPAPRGIGAAGTSTPPDHSPGTTPQPPSSPAAGASSAASGSFGSSGSPASAGPTLVTAAAATGSAAGLPAVAVPAASIAPSASSECSSPPAWPSGLAASGDSASAPSVSAPLSPGLSPEDAAASTPRLAASPQPPGKRPAEVTPLSPDRYRVQVTIGGDTLEKLQLAKDLLRHAVPSGDEAVILDRALTALLVDLAQKKFAAADRPRPATGSSPGSRHIPADVRRTVWLRDLGRCAFVGTSGRRCSERAFLEFHHLQPYALGGEATVANIQLRCRSHNAYEARLYFGHGNGEGNGLSSGSDSANGNGRGRVGGGGSSGVGYGISRDVTNGISRGGGNGSSSGNGGGGGQGGAGMIQEATERYGLPVHEGGRSRLEQPATRFRTSCGSREAQGPAP